MKRILANLSQRQKVAISVVTLIAAAGIYALCTARRRRTSGRFLQAFWPRMRTALSRG